ncbi:MAG: 4Fe-4S binding protein [Spirochaetes bacterium]|jgi:ferredoxin|nr:4Fe-4S binding protein [Spirochaetota bacterium]
MGTGEIYRELSRRLMMENSEILPRIWQAVCTEDEARVVAMLPGTASELAGRAERPLAEMEKMLDSLFKKGAVFESVRDGETVYRMPRHIVQFHDASLLWDGAPEEMNGLWVNFMDTEYVALLELVTQVKMPSFMRVIPINRTLDSQSRVLVYEDAARLIEEARSIAVVPCVCRKSQKLCDRPLEVCIQLNRGAEYTLKRGTGREIGKEEALELLKKAEEAGLVHMVENRAGMGNAICNCCSCCCEMLRYASNAKTAGVLAPSRFIARVDAAVCTWCGACIGVCPVRAIDMTDGPAHVKEGCIGCGLCAASCPLEAITLHEARPAEHIPA